jgi:hypothetical protein
MSPVLHLRSSSYATRRAWARSSVSVTRRYRTPSPPGRGSESWRTMSAEGPAASNRMTTAYVLAGRDSASSLLAGRLCLLRGPSHDPVADRFMDDKMASTIAAMLCPVSRTCRVSGSNGSRGKDEISVRHVNWISGSPLRSQWTGLLNDKASQLQHGSACSSSRSETDDMRRTNRGRDRYGVPRIPVTPGNRVSGELGHALTRSRLHRWGFTVPQEYLAL